MRVYVSSTKVDFEPERRAVIDWLVEAGHQPVHSYAADSETVHESCLGDIDLCDVYVLMLGHRYGFRPGDNNSGQLSITHLEYRRAGQRGLPRVVLVRTSIPDVTLSSIANAEDWKAVLDFRAEVSRETRPAEFNDKASLIAALSTGVGKAMQRLKEGGSQAHGTADAAWRWPAAWDFSAFLASKRAFFTGRDWLFAEVEEWLRRPAPRDLLLRADFGVGKSAFVSELIARDVARHVDARRIAAFHICQHDTRETLRAAVFVRSLASQLAQNIPAYRARVESSLTARQQLDRAGEDPGSACEAAILNPLTTIEAPTGDRLIIIDALDESLEIEATETGRGTLVHLLAEKVPRLPPWMRCLVTTRNNPAVVERLKFAFAPKEIDGEAQLNLDDIREYVRRRCGIAPLAPALHAEGISAESLADRLCDKSGGKFLYAVRALDDVANGWRSVRDLEQLPSGMEAFYADAFRHRFEAAGRQYDVARRLLGVIAVSRQPLTPDLLSDVIGVETASVKGLRADTLTDFIRVRDGEWAFDHLSLREWLTGEDGEGAPRAGAYSVDVVESRAALADWALRSYAMHRAKAPAHVLRHLPAYLHETGRVEELKRLLTDMGWLEAKLAQLGPYAVLADFALAPADPVLDLLAKTLDMVVHILATDPGQLRGQLLGRLDSSMAADLAGLLKIWRGQSTAPWLEPLTSSLPSPGNLVRVFAGHTDILQTCAFSPDGQTVLSASADGTARLWKISGEPIATLIADAGAVSYATFSSRGEWIVTAHEGNCARIWNRTGGLVCVLETPSSATWATFSPDDQLVAVTCREKTAHVWRINGEPVATLRGHDRRVVFVTFSPDGETIATTSRDGAVRLWRASGEAVMVLEGHTDLVPRARFSPDGTRIVTVSSDGAGILWDRHTGARLADLRGHSGAINDAAYNRAGTMIVTGSNDGTARLWRADGEPIAVLQGHTGWVNHVSFSPDDGHVVTASSDNTARVWQATGALVAELRGHSSWVVDAEFSPDGTFVLTCANDYTMRLWANAAARAHTRLGHVDRITGVAFSREGSVVLTTSVDRTAVIWNRYGTPLTVLRGHGDWLTGGEFLADGRVLTAACDTTARLWHANGDLETTFEGHSASVNAATASPEGQIVATASNDGTARLWTLSGELLATLGSHLDAVNHISFSPDGGFVVTSSNDTTAMVWRRDGAPVGVLSGHTGWVNQTWFSPDGRLLVSCSEDGTARLWRPDGTPVAVLASHRSAVVSVRFSLDGTLIVTASRDGTAVMWDVRGTVIAVLGGQQDALTQALFAGAPSTVITSCRDGTVRMWERGTPRLSLNVDAPVESMAFADDLIVCGDMLGGVHFLRALTPKPA
jgi:WD40 repeat protein